MHFETKEDIDSPIADMFAAITDFETFERSAIRRGVEVQRLSEPGETLVGLSWMSPFCFEAPSARWPSRW